MLSWPACAIHEMHASVYITAQSIVYVYSCIYIYMLYCVCCTLYHTIRCDVRYVTQHRCIRVCDIQHISCMWCIVCNRYSILYTVPYNAILQCEMRRYHVQTSPCVVVACHHTVLCVARRSTCDHNNSIYVLLDGTYQLLMSWYRIRMHPLHDYITCTTIIVHTIRWWM